MNIESENTYILEDVSKLVWEYIFDFGLVETSRKIARQYDVGFDTVKFDIEELMDDLINNDIIEVIK